MDGYIFLPKLSEVESDCQPIRYDKQKRYSTRL